MIPLVSQYRVSVAVFHFVSTRQMTLTVPWQRKTWQLTLMGYLPCSIHLLVSNLHNIELRSGIIILILQTVEVMHLAGGQTARERQNWDLPQVCTHSKDLCSFY